MDPDAQDTAKYAELKARLEEIAGRKLNLTDEQLLSFTRPIASSTYLARHDSDDDAWVTSERVWPLLLTCANGNLLDTAGASSTLSNGQTVFRLSNLLCGRDSIAQFFEPVTLIATPEGTSPFFISMSHEFIKDPSGTWNVDVQITVSAWHPNGTPAANVPFYWRCRVPVDIIIE